MEDQTAIKTMEIVVSRKKHTSRSTVSELSINGNFECYCLEDTDRGLKQSMSLSDINKLKKYGETAIPTGRYQVVVTPSARFKRDLPLLVNVPGYEGIRIHTGNVPADTHGCLLPGSTFENDRVSGSTIAFQKLFTKILAAIKANQKIYITIQDNTMFHHPV